jgi:hypothetical protein
MGMKYRQCRTPEDFARFEAELDAIDEAYARQAQEVAPPADWVDEDAELRRAALNRGQP